MSAANFCNTSFTKISFCEPPTLYSRVWKHLTNKINKPSLVHNETIQQCSRNLQLLKDLHVSKTKSFLPGHFNGFRPSVITKAPISYLTEEVSYIRRPNKVAETFLPGDFAGFYEIWTQPINTEVFLPGDFAGFIDIWAQEEEPVQASLNTKTSIFEDFSDICEDTDISIPYMAGDFAGFFDGCFEKQTKTYWPADFFNYEKVKTKRHSYLPGSFYFFGQALKNDSLQVHDAFLPGDFEGFFDIWTTDSFSINVPQNANALAPSDFPCFFQTWISSPKTRPVYFPCDFYFWKNATEEQPEIFFPKDFYFWQTALVETSTSFTPCDFTGFLGVWLSSGYKEAPAKEEVPKKAAPKKASKKARKKAPKKSTAKVHTIRRSYQPRRSVESLTFKLVLPGDESSDEDLSVFDVPRFYESDPSDAELEAYLDKVD